MDPNTDLCLTLDSFTTPIIFDPDCRAVIFTTTVPSGKHKYRDIELDQLRDIFTWFLFFYLKLFPKIPATELPNLFPEIYPSTLTNVRFKEEDWVL